MLAVDEPVAWADYGDSLLFHQLLISSRTTVTTVDAPLQIRDYGDYRDSLLFHRFAISSRLFFGERGVLEIKKGKSKLSP